MSRRPLPQSPDAGSAGIAGPFSQHVVFKILQKLPTASLFTASLVCSEWRRLIYHSGPRSQALLKPHLAVLRERFGPEEVPQRLPIPAVRTLLARFAKEELFGNYCSTTSCEISGLLRAGWVDDCEIPLRLRRFAVSGWLLAVATRSRRVHVFSLHGSPISPLLTIKLPARPIALAISDGYLAVLDEKHVHLYNLLARTTNTAHVYSVRVPAPNPSAIAITSNIEQAPLVAVLATSLYLIHPSHALSQKRGSFFLDEKKTASHAKMLSNSTASSTKSAKSLGKEPERPLAPPVSAGSQLILETPAPPMAGMISFGMLDRQLLVSNSYLGSAWSAESPAELSRRKIYNLKPGQDLAHRPHTTEALWRHYRSTTAAKTSHPSPRWAAKLLDTSEMRITRPVHIFDSYYLVTDLDTGFVRIVSVAPFEARFVLYRDEMNELDGGAPWGPRYAVQAGLKLNGRRVGGYIVFSPADGILKILPLNRVPWENGRGDVGKDCREIAVGEGEIVGLAAGRETVAVVFADRVVVVRLWTRRQGGVMDEEKAWWLDRNGEVWERRSRGAVRVGGGAGARAAAGGDGGCRLM